MAVDETDIVWYESANGSSDGGALSATPVTATKGDFWPNLSSSERLAGGTKYKKSFMVNEHATDPLVEPVVWILLPPQNMTEVLGLGFNDADDDDAAQGNMTAWGANAVVALVSSGADTRTASIYGVDSGGAPVKEDVTLTGTVEVVSLATFSKVHAVKLSAESGSATVTVAQGSGGTVRGTVGPNRETCFLWYAAPAKATGISLPDLVAGTSYGFWHRQVWAPAIGAVRPNTSKIGFEEA